MSVVAVADLFCISGRRQEFRAVLADAERDAAGQPGCVRYSFAATVADADHFLLLSEWRDQAALDAHYASSVRANLGHHVAAWRYYEVRPDKHAARPELTNDPYCVWMSPTRTTSTRTPE